MKLRTYSGGEKKGLEERDEEGSRAETKDAGETP